MEVKLKDRKVWMSSMIRVMMRVVLDGGRGRQKVIISYLLLLLLLLPPPTSTTLLYPHLCYCYRQGKACYNGGRF